MKREKFISLRVKISLGVIIICFLLGSLSIISVFNIASTIIDKEYTDKAEQISEAVANTLDPDDVKELTDAVLERYYGVDEVIPSTEWGSDAWNAYMSNYDGIEELPVFKKLIDHFRKYQDSFKVDGIYLMVYEKEAVHAI